MVIDFEKIAEAHLEGFKGGQGKLDTRNYVDDKVKLCILPCVRVHQLVFILTRATARLSMW